LPKSLVFVYQSLYWRCWAYIRCDGLRLYVCESGVNRIVEAYAGFWVPILRACNWNR